MPNISGPRPMHPLNPMPVAHPTTAAAMVNLLKPLSRGLTLTVGSSEGDEKVKTIVSTDKFAGTMTGATLAKFLKLPTSVKLEGQSANAFFKKTVAEWRSWAKTETDPARKKRFTDDANKLEKIATLMQNNLTDVHLFQDTNQDHVSGRVFIVGKARDGKLVGLETRRIWT